MFIQTIKSKVIFIIRINLSCFVFKVWFSEKIFGNSRVFDTFMLIIDVSIYNLLYISPTKIKLLNIFNHYLIMKFYKKKKIKIYNLISKMVLKIHTNQVRNVYKRVELFTIEI